MKSKPALLVPAIALLVLSSPSHAYLDPNIGSMLLQGLLAGFAAAGVAIKMYWHRISSFFRGSGSDNDNDNPEQPGEDESSNGNDDDRP